jgi:hypothetical protein
MTIKIKRVQRIAVAVKDLDASLAKWKEVLGIEPFQYGIAEKELYHWCAFEIGEGEATMEFLSPWHDPKMEGIIGKYIKKRGEGLYMVTMRTAGSADETVDAMRELDIEPSWGSVGWKDAIINSKGAKYALWQEHYIAPKYLNGVLITLATITDHRTGVEKTHPDFPLPIAGTKKSKGK